MRLGARGWLWPHWGAAYYPGDMPEEWRLAFFNTQFACVFLASALWRDAEAASLKAWADDTHEGFLFLLEGARGEQAPAVFAGRAVVLPETDAAILWFDAGSDLKGLADTIKGRDHAAEYLLSRDGDLGQIERVRILLELLGV